MQASEQREITVIGAGIVGTACAVNLQRLGFTVTVIDRQAPGEECSFGNAGVIAPCACVPVNTPGILFKAPAMLCDPQGPLALRWSYLPRMLPWLFQYLRNSSAARVERAADGMAALTSGALEEHQRLAGGGETARWVQPSPYLYVYESAKGLAADDYAWRLRRERGITTRVLQGGEVQEFEPAIDPRYRCAVVMEQGHGFTPDPSQLVKALTKQFQREGGRVLQVEVHRVELADRKPLALHTSEGRIALKRLVIAAGAWSGKIAADLGEPVPLESERGYHVTINNSGITPRYPIMNSVGKFVVTPMAPGLRFAGLVEFGGLVAKPNYRLSQRLLAHARSMFPTINTDDFTEWMGHRPALPDSLPVIGQSTRSEHVFYAFGHQHIGLTSGPKTGRVLAESIAGQTPDIDLAPYSIQRFSPARSIKTNSGIISGKSNCKPF